MNLNECINYIIKGCTDGDPVPCVGDIVLITGVSEQTLRRRFKHTSYGTFGAMLLHLRLMIIENFKRNDEYDIESLSVRLGFKNSKSLLRFIRDNYNTSIKEFFSSAPKRVYVHEFPNGNIKIGISVFPNTRIEALISMAFSGYERPIKTYITEPIESSRLIESVLIGQFSSSSLEGATEWFSGIEYVDIVARVQSLMEVQPEMMDYYLTMAEINKACCDLGINGVSDLEAITKINESTLIGWFKYNPTNFSLAIDAARYRILS